MMFAYADPPYLGQGKLYKEHPEAKRWDDPAWHVTLVRNLVAEQYDGFVVSMSVPSLPLYQTLLPNARMCVWTKPFAVFKPNVTLAYTWEPVMLVGGRKRTRADPTCRDHLSEGITLQKGTVGAKPLRFNQWVLGLLNFQPGDELFDAFPGSGGMREAIEMGVQDIGGPRKEKKK